MTFSRSLWLHTALLTLGAGVAAWAYTRDKTPGAVQEAEVNILSGRSAGIQRIVYDGKDKKTVLEPQTDKSGSPWYLVTFEKAVAVGPAAHDGGPAAPPPRSTAVFPGSDAAKKVVDSFAPLRAVRSLGKIPDGKAGEYGLEKRDVFLSVVISGLERKFVIGDTAPGGSDLYLMDAANGQAFVIAGDQVKDLEIADSRLMEHELHAWKEADVSSAKIVAGDKSREVARATADNKHFWAETPTSPKADETVVNWMQKIDRLKPTEYASKDPDGRNVVVRIEYTGKGATGFFELSKAPDTAQPGKSAYFVMSEHTHKYAKVNSTAAEQVEQDLGAILK